LRTDGVAENVRIWGGELPFSEENSWSAAVHDFVPRSGLTAPGPNAVAMRLSIRRPQLRVSFLSARDVPSSITRPVSWLAAVGDSPPH